MLSLSRNVYIKYVLPLCVDFVMGCFHVFLPVEDQTSAYAGAVLPHFTKGKLRGKNSSVKMISVLWRQ